MGILEHLGSPIREKFLVGLLAFQGGSVADSLMRIACSCGDFLLIKVSYDDEGKILPEFQKLISDWIFQHIVDCNLLMKAEMPFVFNRYEQVHVVVDGQLVPF